MSKKPNIIIFNPDQMRCDAMHHMGNMASVTPNLDRMAQEDGVSFEHAFCQNPVCVPSRCSFLSGIYPHVRGHRTMYHMLQEDEPILLEELKNAGYYVWQFNRNDFLPAESDRMNRICDVCVEPPMERGIHLPRSVEADKFYSFYRGQTPGENADSDAFAVEKAIECIHNRPKDQPLCIFLPLMYPHVPYQIEQKYYEAICQEQMPPRIPSPDWSKKPSILKGIYELQGLNGWTETDWNALRATYLAMCSRVDDQFGKVMEALKQEGIYDDSAVFFFSDHGDFTGDYGLVEKNQNTFEDCLVNVPFLVKPPKGIPVKPGKRSQLVELVDFYATVADFSGLPDTHTCFGRSLRPLLADAQGEFRDAVFSEGGRLAGELHCMDTGNGRMVSPQNEYYPRLYQQTQDTPAHTKATMCRTQDYKYVCRAYESDEFYDLRTDPYEQDNRIEDPACREIILQMKERMLKWYQETCDVVPYRLNQRFTVENFIRASQDRISAELAEELRKRFGNVILNGNSMHEIMQLIAQNTCKGEKHGN